ncbi:MAG: hypothetical protein KatS3mg094_438 [Candidatus Parcubacteria bacterium]|nr:MAG: hypothetical protein KatS3mg094_438 [Candidatus Parcubacteria bacterium]
MKLDKKRLFIALPLTSGVYPKIKKLEKEIDKKIKTNWIPLNNLHLTLIFLGLIDLNYLHKIIKIFEQTIIENNDFFKLSYLKISKIDYGPPGKKRMIWLYINKNDKLIKMKKILETNLIKNEIKFQKENREFLPHINLARIKENENLPLIEKELKWEIAFNKICLYESYLDKPFARYEILSSVRLLSS